MKAALAPHDVGVKVGDVFVSSWGYDQTNVDFYKVVGLTPKGVKVQKWKQRSVGPERVTVGDGPVQVRDTSAVTPGMDFWDREAATKHVDASVLTKRLVTYGRSVGFTLTSYSSASLWDGAPKYQTGAGGGH